MLIDIRDITKVYDMGEERVRALDGVTLAVDRGEYVGIMGPSGSGKSTLMNLIGCLDTPTSGSYVLNGREVARMTDDELAADPQSGDRVRLPDVQSAAAHDGPPAGGAAARLLGSAPARAQGPRGPRARRRSVWPTAWAITRTRCRAASGSASRSPAHSSTILRSSWPTSRRETSTRRPARRSWALFDELELARQHDHPRHARGGHRRARAPDRAPARRQGPRGSSERRARVERGHDRHGRLRARLPLPEDPPQEFS